MIEKIKGWLMQAWRYLFVRNPDKEDTKTQEEKETDLVLNKMNFIGSMKHQKGLTIWELDMNPETDPREVLREAEVLNGKKMVKRTLLYGTSNQEVEVATKNVVVKKNCIYCQATNRRMAVLKFTKQLKKRNDAHLKQEAQMSIEE